MAKRALILGGGLAGLSAGWKLCTQGVDVEILEADSQVGGLAKSLKHGNFTFDLGPHRFFSKNSQVISEISNLVGEEFTPCVRKSQIHVDGRYLDYPVTAKSILQMNKPTIVVALADYILHRIKNKIRPVSDNNSFESWVVNRFGRTVYNIFFKNYTAKLWGMHPSNISMDWAVQRISLLDLGDVVKRIFIKNDDLPRTYTDVFYYPKGGIGSIAEALSKEIQNNGGIIRTNAKVNELEVQNGRINAITYNNGSRDKQEKTAGDFIVSTIPITNLVKGLRPSTGAEVLNCVDKLKYRALIFFYLMINKERITDNHWLYFPESKYIFNRISESKVFSANMGPVGKTSLCAEVTCNVSDDIWNAHPYELSKQIIDGLEEVGLVKKDEIVDYFVHKEPHAYPIYHLSYKENLKVVMAYIKRIENLLSIGRQGLFRYNNMDESIEIGFETAKSIISNNHYSLYQ